MGHWTTNKTLLNRRVCAVCNNYTSRKQYRTCSHSCRAYLANKELGNPRWRNKSTSSNLEVTQQTRVR